MLLWLLLLRLLLLLLLVLTSLLQVAEVKIPVLSIRKLDRR